MHLHWMNSLTWVQVMHWTTFSWLGFSPKYGYNLLSKNPQWTEWTLWIELHEFLHKLNQHSNQGLKIPGYVVKVNMQMRVTWLNLHVHSLRFQWKVCSCSSTCSRSGCIHDLGKFAHWNQGSSQWFTHWKPALVKTGIGFYNCYTQTKIGF